MKKRRILPALIAALAITSAFAQIGPDDLSRAEGEENVFIPCPFDTGIAPFWRINNTYYHHTRLPCPFLASTSPAGLVITVVDLTLSGTTFQCLAPRNGMLEESSTGELTVIDLPDFTMNNGGGGDTTPDVELLYQQLRITSEELSLSWSIFDKDVVADGITSTESSLRSIVYASTCDLNNVSVVDNTTRSTTVFPLQGYEDAFFNITAYNESGQISTVDEPFRIEAGVVTRTIPDVFVGRTCPACVTIPQPDTAPFFNVPQGTGSNRHDSLCKAVRAPSETDRCLDLASSCDRFSDSPLSSSLTVCSSTVSTTDYQLCLRNVTRDMNGTKIHFYYTAKQPCSITSDRVTSSLYIASYEIIAQDSSVSVDVSTNMTTGELCIMSLPAGCYATTIYNITITDITDYSVATTRGIQDGNCTEVDVLRNENPACAPYMVAIDAYNPLVAYSETIRRRVGGEATSSFCDCAKSKARVVLTATANNGIEFNCNTEDVNIGFHIVALGEDNQPTILSRGLLTCDATPRSVQTTDLVCGVQYSVSANFAFPNGSLTTCTLSDTTITISEDCQTTTSPTASPTTIPIQAVIAIAVVVVLVVIAVLITIIVVVWCVVKRRYSGSYEPRTAENRQLSHLNNQSAIGDESPVQGRNGSQVSEQEAEKADFQIDDLNERGSDNSFVYTSRMDTD